MDLLIEKLLIKNKLLNVFFLQRIFSLYCDNNLKKHLDCNYIAVINKLQNN